MNEPVPLRAVAKEPRAPKPHVIKALEDLLDEARLGDLQGFAYAAIEADEEISTGWTRDASWQAMLAGIALLQHRFIAGEIAD